MKKLFHFMVIISFIFILGCSASDSESIAKNKSETASDADSTKVVWMAFNAGIEKGVKENKNIIVDFYTDWCHWCKVMDEKTFSDPKVAKELKEKFITIRINAESKTEKASFQGNEYTNVELTHAFHVTGFPSLAFISPQQEVITVIPGYIPAEQFYYLLSYVDQECYKKQLSLDEFIKRKGDCDSTKGQSGKI